MNANWFEIDFEMDRRKSEILRLQAVNRKLVEALNEIKAYVHNRDHTICQGGHRPHCDCLGMLLEDLAEQAMSEAALPQVPIDMKFSHESLMRIAKEEEGVRFSVGSAEAALPQAAPTCTCSCHNETERCEQCCDGAAPTEGK